MPYQEKLNILGKSNNYDRLTLITIMDDMTDKKGYMAVLNCMMDELSNDQLLRIMQRVAEEYNL